VTLFFTFLNNLYRVLNCSNWVRLAKLLFNAKTQRHEGGKSVRREGASNGTRGRVRSPKQKRTSLNFMSKNNGPELFEAGGHNDPPARILADGAAIL
jgi:hypothetical protein